MACLLRPHWQRRVVKPKKKQGRPYGIGGLEDHLLVMLVLYRCHITQDFMACLYGVDRAASLVDYARISALIRVSE